MTNLKKIYIIGGGTFNHVRTHLSLSVPAFGTTAKQLYEIAKNRFTKLETKLVLTKMANSNSDIITNDDVENWINTITNLNDTKIVFFNVALCDYEGSIEGDNSGKYARRLETSEGETVMNIKPSKKLVSKIREKRKDIFLVGFKTTSGLSEQEQYIAGLNLLKETSCNLVFSNDVITRKNMIITPEEEKYHVTTNRMEALTNLVDMAYLRSHVSFTRSTVIAGESIPWASEIVPDALREVVNHCIKNGAYKVFRGATVDRKSVV